ncbi:hypothetical protein KPH14_010212 [Odynerus spinipes]|uniref:Uncharacterized protein n=1 Tax=Odynerus spinipes TaxID=1348599 RepID=A0AAD9RUB3_9HYME|nr:hypothetical protein KPH14_010212 [Odynerus spinipes]
MFQGLQVMYHVQRLTHSLLSMLQRMEHEGDGCELVVEARSPSSPMPRWSSSSSSSSANLVHFAEYPDRRWSSSLRFSLESSESSQSSSVVYVASVAGSSTEAIGGGPGAAAGPAMRR